ncbi:hypothetical protein GE09DRAFT_1207576 [Coniochaeta sp. 2T2.1]|nr:hypothetical protein GE09DRAFT_1207576 [Coniochaeta sp. 2T2.1]
MIKRAVAYLSLLASSALCAAGACSGNDTAYDYIVVGSGPGGAPLAVNLAKAGHSVLLLEAGDDQTSDITTHILALGSPIPTNRWDFYVNQSSNDAQNLKNNHLTWKRADGSLWVGNGSAAPADAKLLGVYYPRGATLGGSSVINAAGAVLPSRSDWDDIGQTTGDKSWSNEKLRSLFERVERNHYLPPGTPGHGFDGYLDINGNNGTLYEGQPDLVSVLKSMISETGGNPEDVMQLVQRDINNVSPDRDTTPGLYGLPFHANETWSRFSSRDIVRATLAAKNADGSPKYPLTLKTQSLVTRVVFDKSGNKPRATGVEYLAGRSLYNGDPRHNASATGTKHSATARREVILSGGVFNSPQLLQLSGVGPAAELALHNIPLVADLPGVGAHLQDNYELPYNAFLWKSNHSATGENDVLFFTFPNAAFRGFWPGGAVVNIPPEAPGTIGMSMVKLNTRNGAGTVRLRNANPQDTPEINFHIFEAGAETDLEGMADAAAWSRKVYGGVGAPLGPVRAAEPPCSSEVPAECRAGDREWIKEQTFGHHAIGTCGMGADDDPMAVVDSKFRVRGVDSLRVVDGSVFPRPPGAFPVIATFLISEKASEVILEDANDCEREIETK